MARKVETVRIYSDGKRKEDYPFDGWRYYTEYRFDENGISQSSGVNQETKGKEYKR